MLPLYTQTRMSATPDDPDMSQTGPRGKVVPDLTNEALAARLLVSELRAHDEAIIDDAEILSATIEGETNLVEAAAETITAIDLDAAHVAAIEQTIDRLKARMARLERRAQRRRDALLGALELAGLTSLPTPPGTLVVQAGRQRAIVTDESRLPEQYMVEKITRRPNLPALAEALKSGPVPGAEMSNATPALMIKRK